MCSFGKIKIIKICSYFMRMRLSEKVWMYFTFHMSRYTNCRTPKMCSFVVGWTESSAKLFFHWLLVFYGVSSVEHGLFNNNFMYVQFDDSNVFTRNCVCVCTCLWSKFLHFKCFSYYKVELKVFHQVLLRIYYPATSPIASDTQFNVDHFYNEIPYKLLHIS